MRIKLHRRKITIFFTTLVILFILPTLISHWDKQGKVGDFVLLEVLFFSLGEVAFIIKNWNK